MNTDEDLLNKFKVNFENDYGQNFTDDQAKEALINLVNFFDLLWHFDQEDKKKEMQMEVKQNGG